MFGIWLRLELLVEFQATPIVGFRQAQLAGVSCSIVFGVGWDVAGGGKNDSIGGEIGVVLGVFSHLSSSSRRVEKVILS